MFQERRKFFRIKDVIGVSYHLLTEAEKSIVEKEVDIDDAMLESMDRLNAQLLRMIDNVQMQHPDLALALQLMNRKINALSEKYDLSGHTVADINFNKSEVSLSANGIAFPCEHHFQSGDLLRVDILLDKANLQMSVISRVVSCESVDKPKMKNKPYYLRLHFVKIKEQDQEMLAQYVINQQNAFFSDNKVSKDSRTH